MADTLQVKVVAADREVWSGEADQVIARTSEGDTGILANHSPMLGVLVPSAVVIFATHGEREIVAVDGGFISVDHNRVSILSEYAKLAGEISVDQAEKELAEANRLLDQGDDSEETRRHYLRASGQLKAAQKRQGSNALG